MLDVRINQIEVEDPDPRGGEPLLNRGLDDADDHEHRVEFPVYQALGCFGVW